MGEQEEEGPSEWKEFWGSEPTVDQTFKAHVFRVNNTFPAVQQMVVWFLLAFTKPQDVVWQLNGTSIPFFSECAIATGRLPLVVVDEEEEDSALTRLLAVETFVRTEPIDMEQHRQRRSGNVLWEKTGSGILAGITPPVALWSGYSEPERVITILGLVSCTQNATQNADVGSFTGEYASATWFVDSQTPIDEENDSQTQADDQDAGAGSGRDDDLLTKDLRIGKSSLLTRRKRRARDWESSQSSALLRVRPALGWKAAGLPSACPLLLLLAEKAIAGRSTTSTMSTSCRAVRSTSIS